MSVLDVREVTKQYGDLHALRGVSFSVQPGECYALLGPNGAGKTTLFKLVTAYARRTGGELEVFGSDPQRHPTEVKARLGVVGQEDNLDPDLNVVDNLRVYGRYHGLGGPEFEARCERLLEFLELTSKREMPIVALSGGMKRRLMIVRALLNVPELLLLDEPTTGLDPQIRHAIWRAVRRLKDEGLTILLTTHYMEEAAQLADRIGIIDHGTMIAEDTPSALVAGHLPAYVLEWPGPAQDSEGWRALGERPGAVLEEHGDRVYLFHPDEPTLRSWSAELGLHGATLRGTCLEDVFLKLTGRNLRDA
jgi:lipooligosaccharide transport system ATP-binding protein